MSLAEGKVTKSNDVEVGAQGGVKEIALESSLNVTTVAEPETSNQPDQDEVFRSGLQPSDKVNQEHVTTAAGYDQQTGHAGRGACTTPLRSLFRRREGMGAGII